MNSVFLPFLDGKQQLVAANVGDARVVLSRGAKAVQLSFDHKVSLSMFFLCTVAAVVLNIF